MRRWMKGSLVAVTLLGTAAYAEADKKTERVWKSKCSSCHGMDGKAQTEKGKKMKIADYSSKEWQANAKDDQLLKAINEGVKAEKDGVKQEMDGYQAELKPGEAEALVKLIRGLAK